MFRSPRGIPSISTKKNGVATVQIGDTHSPVFGLHASQTNGITLAFPLLGGYGFSETSTKHSLSKTLSLYLVVTSVHVSHHRRDPPSFNTTRTSGGVCLYFLHDNHRKLGGTRTRLSACCCCCCVSWLRPPQAFSKPRA